jgi:hypothetical protein
MNVSVCGKFFCGVARSFLEEHSKFSCLKGTRKTYSIKMAHRGDDYFHEVPANPTIHLANLNAVPLNPNVAQVAESTYISEGVKRRLIQNEATDADVVAAEERVFESVQRRHVAAPQAVGIAQEVFNLLTAPQGPLTVLQNQFAGLQNQVAGLTAPQGPLTVLQNQFAGLRNQVAGLTAPQGPLAALQNQVAGLQNDVNGLTIMAIEAWNEAELTRARAHNSTQQARLMFPRIRFQGQNNNQAMNCPVVVATVLQLQRLSGPNLTQILRFYFTQNFNVPHQLRARRLLVMKHLGIVLGPAA